MSIRRMKKTRRTKKNRLSVKRAKRKSAEDESDENKPTERTWVEYGTPSFFLSSRDTGGQDLIDLGWLDANVSSQSLFAARSGYHIVIPLNFFIFHGNIFLI
jgi:hypothetical protein